MKNMCLVSIVTIMILAVASPVLSALDDFEGTWKNIESETRGITTIKIWFDGNKVLVQVFGSCIPKDCNWGRVTATAYTRNVSSDLKKHANVISAVFRETFAETILIIDRPQGNQPMEVRALTQFTDGSGRSNYQSFYQLKRVK